MSGSSGRHRERRPTTDTDLARLAAGYAHRPADRFVLDRAEAIGRAAGVAVGSVAVDIGSGPGEHAAVWADRLGAHAIAVDPSPDMNRLARVAGPDLGLVRARAERLPLADDVAQLAYFHLSIHHTQWRSALEEAARIVVAGGSVVVLTLGPDHHRRSFMQRWFPRVGELDLARFPDPADIARELAGLGGEVVARQVVQTKRRRAGEWVAAVRARFVSTLQLLHDGEIEDGLERMLATVDGPDTVLAYPMLWEHVTARF